MKFKKQYDKVERHFSVNGDGTASKYEYVVENGKKVRKLVGKTNVYELIQASLPSTDINSILIRVANGEANLLNVPNLGFIDTSSLPLNEEERIEMVSKAKQDFEKLDPKIKQAFGNNFGNFYKAVADGIAEKAIQEALTSAKRAANIAVERKASAGEESHSAVKGEKDE